jgi:hypothetical protein
MMKIVQIVTMPRDTASRSPDLLYALCDDGTVWVRVVAPGAEWEQVPPIDEETAQ